METLLLILKIALTSAGIGALVILNIFIWGGIVAILKRGRKNGNYKDIYKH